ncbi:MAG: transglycosylase SLT domain-containing protein [Candidatus Hydrogenedentes bacterium]|nr:transglycosylase SLT domain-containing protein [Candidatus Hydrogenedentota bacterium]
MTAVPLITILFTLGVLPGEAEYLAAAAAEDAGQFLQAAQAFDACATAPGPLRAFARVRAARCRAKGGDAEGAIRAYQSVLAQEPGGPWQRMTLLHLAGLLADLKRYADAAPLFAEGLKTAARPWWMRDYAFRAAENLVTLEPAKPEHYAYFRSVVSSTLLVRPRLDAARKLALSPVAEDRVLAVYGFLRSSSWKEAAATLLAAPQALKTSGGVPLDLAVFQRLLEQGAAKAPDGLASVQDAIAKNRDNPWLRAWLYYGVCLAVSGGRQSDAAFFCDALAQQCPQSMDTGEALWKLAESREGAGDAAGAADTFERLAAVNSGHRLAPFALFHAGRLRLAAKGLDAALPAWETLAQGYPEHMRTSEAWYAAAQFCGAKGDAARAQVFLTRAAGRGTGDYFAHRAFAQIELPGAAPVPNLLIDGRNTVLRPFPVAATPPGQLPAGFESIPAIERLRFFAGNGLEESEWEALELCETFQGCPCEGLVYRILAEAGLAHTALECAAVNGWGIESGKKTLDRLRLEYPRAYWPAVKDLAKQLGLDPYLVLAVARQESTFRPSLVSHAGATGVMQVMPGTASYVAKIEPSVLPDDVTRLKHPAVSLRIGANYLMRMVERSGGHLMYALASYNAGPGNCAKWKKAFGNYDFDAFVAAIPFTETRDYVKKVLANYAAYRSLYPGTE